jgi:uncharacterized phage protein gp47/JayE
MSSLGLSITSAGATVPSFATILSALQNLYTSIYGSDINLDASTQDAQFLNALANAINDANNGGLAGYLAFSPATAQGAGLDSVVKINGIKRIIGTPSTAQVTIVGQANTLISGGQVGDNQNLGTVWNLPASVTIPIGGSITVTATCSVNGPTAAGAATLVSILTPTFGWQTVTNASQATPGTSTETDAQLRIRQSNSVALPAQAIVEGIYAAVEQVAGVQRIAIYVNDTGAPDINGVPAHSIAAVVEGGNTTSIGNAIALKKPPGSGTAGTTAITVVDSHGVTDTINFYVMTEVTINVQVTIKALTGYTATIGTLIQSAVASFISALPPHGTVYLNQVLGAAALGGANGATFNVTGVLQDRGGPLAGSDIAIAFNEGAACVVANVTLVVT